MTFCFYLQFASSWGEQLSLSYTCGNVSKVMPMAYLDANTWWVEVTEPEPGAFRYQYLLNGQAERFSRLIAPSPHARLTVRDEWAAPSLWLTTPFRLPPQADAPLQEGNCEFRVLWPRQAGPLWLLGNAPELGRWDPAAAIPMHYAGNGYYSVSLQLPAGSALEYKYYRNGAYEEGENRHAITGAQTLIQDVTARFPNAAPKGAGVAVPVFSLRSQSSCGVGEFADIRLLADWAAATGQRVIQLLPVNDTTVDHRWTDSYPYAIVSAFALHPIYLHLPAVRNAAGDQPGNTPLPDYDTVQPALNAAPLLDYEAVVRYKVQCLEILYRQHVETEDYRNWIYENDYWLQPYAAFCGRRDGRADVAFYCFVQYHLHLQLLDAVTYAARLGIAVKGDLPIGLNLQSADVAEFPALFHTGLQAGAPPDDFAEKGQNWGFPTYNWPAMEADGYRWWKARLQHMAGYFSAFRIDHILGFFRIWQIPRHARDGLLGYFEPALPFSGEELHQWGIPFSREHYCEPYITDAVLYAVFSVHAMEVKAVCLEPLAGGRYRLLPAYRTQAQVLAAGLHPAIEAGLLTLIADVLFLEPEPGKFHPRFNLHRTNAFEALEPEVQQRLHDLAEHFFYHRHNRLWEQEALWKLPALQAATNMLVCGEDLGMVPDCVPGVLRQLGILSLEVGHMPRYAGRVPAGAPYLSVVTPSTHDMPTLREWRPGGIRETLEAHLHSPAMWCIPQLQDWLALDPSLPQLPAGQERINDPSVMPWYWRYRMPLTLEQLLQAQPLNDTVARLIRESCR